MLIASLNIFIKYAKSLLFSKTDIQNFKMTTKQNLINAKCFKITEMQLVKELKL